MKKELLIKKFKKIINVEISDNYLVVATKEKWFCIDVKKLLEIFEYLNSKGYDYVGELGIDCNKFIFKKRKK